MLNRENSNNSLSTEVFDLSIEDQDYFPVDNGFAFGVGITNITGTPVELDPTYITLEIKQGKSYRVGNYNQLSRTSLGYKVWDSNDLPIKNQEFFNRGLNKALYWPIDKRYKISGNYLADNYQYVSIVVRRCAGTGCKPSALIDAYLSTIVFSVAVLNSYMDFNDFSTPVKTFLDDRNAFTIVPSFTKYVKLYARLNDANLDDDYLGLKSPKNEKFWIVNKSIVDLAVLTNNAVLDASIFIDCNKDTYKRTVFTIMDLFGNVGGIYGLFMSAWGFFVGIISSQILLASVFRRLYFTNKANLENVFLKVIDRSRRVANMPEEESKRGDLRSKFMSILSRRDESNAQSDITLQLKDSNSRN